MSYRANDRSRRCLTVMLALAGFPALAAQTVPAHYVGVAHAIGKDTVRYREEHWITDNQGHRERLVLYRCPDGQPFARKIVRYADTPWAPSFDYEDARSGYRESVAVDGDHLTVTVRKGGGKAPESTTLPRRPDTVVDAGFDDFVGAHWADLQRPEGIDASFVVPSRMDQLRLNIRPIASTDPRFRQFRMALDGWLGAIAPTVTLTYTADDHRLASFEGLSNVKGNDGENQKVRIDFPPRVDAGAPSPDELAKAREVPLVNRCSP